MFEQIGDIFIRSIFSFSVLLLFTRWMGKKQMAHLTYFHYVTGITIGSIAAATTVQKDVHLFDGLYGLTFWTVFTIFLNMVILGNRTLRKIIDGEPCLVICNGQILEQNMRKMKYSLDDLMEELRQKNIFSITDIQFAVLESDGKISVQVKPEKQMVSRQDLQIKAPPQTLQTELIMDGQIIRQNLIQKNLSEEWLINELNKHNIFDLSEVTYACLDSNNKIYIDVKKDDNTKPFNITD